jgi:hypothetical protein
MEMAPRHPSLFPLRHAPSIHCLSLHVAPASRPSQAKKLLDAVSARASKTGGRFTGHAFSAANPHGKRASGDKRQFSRI